MRPRDVFTLISKLRSAASPMAASRPTTTPVDQFQRSPFSCHPRKWVGFKVGLSRDSDTKSLFSVSSKITSPLFASSTLNPGQFTSPLVPNKITADSARHLFDEIEKRFLCFKKQKYLQQLERFQSLAAAQSPKFMVIACADSRVCPSNVLGFQPGEAFMIRNVANIVPPLESGPSETNAALEFAVTTLQVEHVFIIGHSNCAGIQTLMNMNDEEELSCFTKSWVANGKAAKTRTTSETANQSFEQQCRYCEKESINHSMLNLLTYPWIKEVVEKGSLAVHGGHYNFVDCTFEKWTLDFESFQNGGRHCFKDGATWA